MTFSFSREWIRSFGEDGWRRAKKFFFSPFLSFFLSFFSHHTCEEEERGQEVNHACMVCSLPIMAWQKDLSYEKKQLKKKEQERKSEELEGWIITNLLLSLELASLYGSPIAVD